MRRAASEVFNRWLVQVSREDVLVVDQPWNQRAFCTYGIRGCTLKPLRFPVDTIVRCDAQCDAQGDKGWTLMHNVSIEHRRNTY